MPVGHDCVRGAFIWWAFLAIPVTFLGFWRVEISMRTSRFFVAEPIGDADGAVNDERTATIACG